jgi:hypothetical protein
MFFHAYRVTWLNDSLGRIRENEIGLDIKKLTQSRLGENPTLAWFRGAYQTALCFGAQRARRHVEYLGRLLEV